MSHLTVLATDQSSALVHRFAHVDAMRAFAVVLVILGHAGLGDVIPGGSGVTIFFAISGFIITNLLLKEKVKSGGFDLKAFYARRILKIFPPFLAVIAIPTIVLAFFEQIRWDLFTSQVLFYFNWIYMTNGDAGLLPGSGVVWSLSIEEQFYIGFALVWLAAVRSKYYLSILTIIAITGAIAPLVIRIIIALTDFSHSRVYYGTDTRLDAIAIGILAAIVYFRFNETGARTARFARVQRLLERDRTLLVASLLYFGSLVIRDEVFRETLRYTMQSLAAALVILYGLQSPGHPSFLKKAFNAVIHVRIVQIIGLASYSIYLVHLQLIILTEALFPTYIGAGLIILNSMIGVLAGYAIWLIIEKPTERLKKRLFQTQSTTR